MTPRRENSNREQSQVVFQPHALPLHDLDQPAEGEAHLWFMDLLLLGNPLDAGHKLHADGLNAHQLRNLRRFYLRLLIGAYLGLAGKDVHITRAQRGKPRLDQAHHRQDSLQFSSATSTSSCLVGISRSAAVGVDLESWGRKAYRPLALARRYFAMDEYQRLQEFPASRLDEAFLHTWACKEAVVKAAGHGIANQLCRFGVSVEPSEAPAMLHMQDDNASAWRLATFRPGADHFGAIALRSSELTLKGFVLKPPG